MDNKKALRLLTSFAVPPLLRDLCGKSQDKEAFLICAKGGDCTNIEKRLVGFPNLSAFMKLLKSLGQENLSDGIETYCFGSDLLKRTGIKDFKKLLNYLEKNGTSKALINHLRENPPKFFVPFHTWYVLLNFKRSGKTDLTGPNNCMVRWGRVSKVTHTDVTVELNSLEFKNNTLSLAVKTQVIPLSNSLLDEISKGDTVALHWNWIFWKLNKTQKDNLRQWTKRTIKNYDNL